jgi:hypothetical protein
MVPAILVFGLPTLLAFQAVKHFMHPSPQVDLKELHAVR